MAVDVVYHLGTGSKRKNVELRYALRALERNFLDLGEVFVVGFKPKWLSSAAIHLDVPDKHRHNKDANLIDKVVAACLFGVSDTFVRSSDDEMILLPSRTHDLRPYHGGDLKTRKVGFWNGKWKSRLKRTMELLESRGATTFHYDTHLPKVYSRDKFLEIASSCDYKSGPGYTIDTLFLNLSGVPNPTPVAGNKLTLEGRCPNAAKLRERLIGKRYLGYNDGGLTGVLREWFQEAYPEPSRFETDGAEFVRGMTLASAKKVPAVVAVVGTGRSGTSVTAGIIHHLGVSMGAHLRAPTRVNPTGFFEAMPLRKICRAKCSRQERVKKFRDWAVSRGKRDGDMIGGKYAMLCEQIPEMVEAWPKLKIVAVHRPLEEIVPSMVKARLDKPRDSPAAMERLARKRIDARDRDLKKLNPDTLHVQFHDILDNPGREIDRIIAFLGISPTGEQKQAALAFVDPKLHHNRVDYCPHRKTCPHSRDCDGGTPPENIPEGSA